MTPDNAENLDGVDRNGQVFRWQGRHRAAAVA
jgi:hypothetical protein